MSDITIIGPAGNVSNVTGGTSSAPPPAIPADSQLITWALTQAFATVTATRNGDGILTSAKITWPDGATGNFTTDTIDDSGAIDSWHATYVVGNTTKTLTQLPVTRDSSDGVVAQPQITIT